MQATGLMRALLGLVGASLALLGLVYGGTSLTSRWVPAGLPGHDAWGYGSALLVLLASAALLVPRAAPAAALAISGYLAIWTLSFTPQIVAQPASFGGWYGFCEAFTALAGACTLSVLLLGPRSGARLLRTIRLLLGLVCLFYGASHLAYADFTASMVPPWMPARLPLAYLTGVFHMAAGVALAIDVLPLLAAALEALMMALFSALVWVPSFVVQPRPAWAGTAQNQWSELVVSLMLGASTAIVAGSLARRSLSAP